jgi:2-(1,2-epoxy-1,2-dihydrophenyl)acetyl-CoA isomerase
LPRLVGLREALEIALLRDTFDAAEALRLGIVNRVVPVAALGDETKVLASRLANGPPLAQGEVKRLMRQSFIRGLEEQLNAQKNHLSTVPQRMTSPKESGRF